MRRSIQTVWDFSTGRVSRNTIRMGERWNAGRTAASALQRKTGKISTLAGDAFARRTGWAFTGEVTALAACARSLADTMEMAARAAAYGALSETLGRVEKAYEFYLDEEKKDTYLLPICLCGRDAVWTLEKLLKEREEEIGLEERIGLYRAILRFYGEDEDWTTYRSGHFGDGRKALYYSEKAAQAYAQFPDGGARYADVVVRDGGDMFCGFQTDVSYEAYARGESMNGNHEEAIALYKKAIEAGECEAEELYPSIGLEYAEFGAYEEAVFYLREAAQIEREKGFEQAGTLELLVGVYWEMCDQASVASCSRLVMAEQEEAARRTELWKDAARAYADREDYEAAARCCERLLALWQEDGAKEKAFADYCEAYMAYIRTFIKAGRTEDARRHNDRICREIAAECRRRADTGDAEEILKYELFWYLEAFAENYEQLGDPVRAVTAMLTGVILSLEGRSLQARDWERICGTNPDPEWMAERAEELLRGGIQQGEALDRMTAAFARVEQSAAWEKEFPQLRAAYREFQERCQYRNIELKR